MHLFAAGHLALAFTYVSRILGDSASEMGIPVTQVVLHLASSLDVFYPQPSYMSLFDLLSIWLTVFCLLLPLMETLNGEAKRS